MDRPNFIALPPTQSRHILLESTGTSVPPDSILDPTLSSNTTIRCSSIESLRSSNRDSPATAGEYQFSTGSPDAIKGDSEEDLDVIEASS
jgi:hypothetical protein